MSKSLEKPMVTRIFSHVVANSSICTSDMKSRVNSSDNDITYRDHIKHTNLFPNNIKHWINSSYAYDIQLFQDGSQIYEN